MTTDNEQLIAAMDTRAVREMEAEFDRFKAFTEEGAAPYFFTQETVVEYVLHLREELAALAAKSAASDAEEMMTGVLVAHQRRDSQYCLCGWGELGRSHARHQAQMLVAALSFGEDQEDGR